MDMGTPSEIRTTHSIPTLPKPVLLGIQWNINGYFNNLGDLELLIQPNEPWVLALQEVNKVSTEQMNRSLGGRYRWTVKRGNNFRHSVAIGVREGIPYDIVNVDSDLPVVCIRLKGSFPISVCNCYLPCGPLPNIQTQMREMIDQMPEPRLLLGDLNAHHPTWGGNRSDPRGVTLLNTFEEHDLIALNDGSATFFNGRYSSAIDVSAISRSVANKFQWKAVSDLHGSDHHPIHITIAAEPPPTSRRPRWMYERADWDYYQNNIQHCLVNQPPTTFKVFTEMIFKAAESSIPRTSNKPGRKALRWWSDDTKKAVKARRKALRAARRLPLGHPNKETALQEYRLLHIRCRRTIQNAKRASWEEFLESMNASQTSAELWSRVNALSGKRKQSPLVLQVHDQWLSDPSSVAEALGEYFHSLSAIDSYEPTFKRRVQPSHTSLASFRIPNGQINLPINNVFTFRELEFALSCCSGKSAGPDGIGYPLIKNLPPVGKTHLLELVNQAWISDTLPQEWRESLVVPIPKANSAAHDPSKFRPIALTCCLCKVMERLVNRRLKQQLETEERLDYRQHAFRAGRGTSTYFASLGETLHEAYTKELHTEVISLDLSKAFNRTWTPLALQQLVNWGFSGHVLHFLKNFLTTRTFRVAVGDSVSSSFAEETGVPQGSVIAVTLFLIAMNGVFAVLPKGIYVYVYADDILLVVTGRTPVRTRIKAQAAVNAVVKWASSVGFSLSAPKSIRCHICPLGHRIAGTPITIQGQPIPSKKTIKTLGVMLDRKLTFRQHFDAVKNSCRTRLNLVRTISRPHRSNNRAIRFRVAQAIIDSRLLYGLELTCIATNLLIKTLAPVYNEYVRTISGLLPSTPADAACVEAGLHPFRYRVSEAICAKAMAYTEKTSGKDKIFLLAEGDRIFHTAANMDLPPVARIQWYGDRSWQTVGPAIDNRIKNQFRAGTNSIQLRTTVLDWLRTKYSDHEVRYTDGSLSTRGVGIGIYGQNLMISKSLHPWCSIFSAEAAAVLIAASRPSNQPILVLTDSASVVSALQAEYPTHPWIQSILRTASPNTTFAWVPGHCGISGNETADKLAGTGHTKRRHTKNVPLDDVRRNICKLFRERWGREWDQSRTHHLRKVKATINVWSDIHSLKDQRIISRLRTGHTRLSHNMSGPTFHTTCTICNVRNSVEHILCVCPLHEHQRRTHGLTGSIRDVLGNDKSTLTTVISFLKDAGLYFQI